MMTHTQRRCVRCGVDVATTATVGAITCDSCWKLATRTQWFKGASGFVAVRVLVWLLYAAVLAFVLSRPLLATTLFSSAFGADGEARRER